ncbi:MAG: hypothetical protein LBS27_00910 [Bifidobacteriaceae bacterium]|jgi:hypothetical protein|nr:hypothetical protein [Bifidobacteriaceae bacterium]
MRDQRSTAVLALAALLALALGVGAYFLLYAPTLDARSEAIRKAEEVEKANAATQKELTQLAADSKRLEEMKAELAIKRDQFPTSLELAEFTDDLIALAEQSQAVVDSVTRQAPAEVLIAQPLPEGPGGQTAPTIPQPPPGLYQYQFTIEIQGMLAQTQEFLRLLQADEGRMFLVTGVQMTGEGPTTVDGITTATEYSITGFTYALVPANQIPGA